MKNLIFKLGRFWERAVFTTTIIGILWKQRKVIGKFISTIISFLRNIDKRK